MFLLLLFEGWGHSPHGEVHWWVIACVNAMYDALKATYTARNSMFTTWYTICIRLLSFDVYVLLAGRYLLRIPLGLLADTSRPFAINY